MLGGGRAGMVRWFFDSVHDACGKFSPPLLTAQLTRTGTSQDTHVQQDRSDELVSPAHKPLLSDSELVKLKVGQGGQPPSASAI